MELLADKSTRAFFRQMLAYSRLTLGPLPTIFSGLEKSKIGLDFDTQSILYLLRSG